MTGDAIRTKKAIIANNGYREKHFAPEIDNFMNVSRVKNLLIGPMLDKNGDVRGII